MSITNLNEYALLRAYREQDHEAQERIRRQLLRASEYRAKGETIEAKDKRVVMLHQAKKDSNFDSDKR